MESDDMTIAFSKDTRDTRTPDGRNRHGFYQPSLETALCLASVFADLQLAMDRDIVLNEYDARAMHAEALNYFLGSILDAHS